MAQESKSISVAPSSEQSQIELWQDFGWVLKSSQEILNRDSHLEDRGGDLYSVTTTQNYVKLVFSRDTDIKNYQEIASLENEYNSELSKLWDYPDGPHLNKWWLISFLVYGIGLVLFIILKIVNKKKTDKTYAHNTPILERLDELRKKAKELSH